MDYKELISHVFDTTMELINDEDPEAFSVILKLKNIFENKIEQVLKESGDLDILQIIKKSLKFTFDELNEDELLKLCDIFERIIEAMDFYEIFPLQTISEDSRIEFARTAREIVLLLEKASVVALFEKLCRTSMDLFDNGIVV